MRDDPRKQGLWKAFVPPAPDIAPLRSDLTAYAVVIGTDLTGLSAALHVAQGGTSLTVLGGVEIGFRGLGRNVGLVNIGVWIMPDEAPSALGELLRRRLGPRPQAAQGHRLPSTRTSSALCHAPTSAQRTSW